MGIFYVFVFWIECMNDAIIATSITRISILVRILFVTLNMPYIVTSNRLPFGILFNRLSENGRFVYVKHWTEWYGWGLPERKLICYWSHFTITVAVVLMFTALTAIPILLNILYVICGVGTPSLFVVPSDYMLIIYTNISCNLRRWNRLLTYVCVGRKLCSHGSRVICCILCL
jgi:hypothetical protein